MPPILSALLLSAAYAIQPPGQFHAGETVARDGERWLALRVQGTAAALVATRLQVRPVHDALLDAPGQTTGMDVASPPGEGVVAFLRGPALRAGEVEAAQPASGETSLIQAGQHLELLFRGARHRLAAECTPALPSPEAGQARFDCQLVLHAPDGRTQTLARLGGYREAGGTAVLLGDDAAPTLLFAGDLDRDGRLDLLLDLTDHYNVSRPTLLLSSPAAANELVREVAHHASVGC